MKVLAIISSFRKKNTYNAVKEIERVHQGVTSCEYEYLFLKDINLKMCKGCHLCLTVGEQDCPLEDDRDIIIAKIESADAVILASPNHTMNVNWLMKNFIDRLSYLMHRPRFFSQQFMVLITSGSFMGVKNAIKVLSPMASGGKIVSRVGVMNSPGMNDSKVHKEGKKLIEEAKRFALLTQKEHIFRASLMNMVWFAAFKATSSANTEEYPADFEYYRDKDFFTATKLNLFQRHFITFFTSCFSLLLKRGVI